MRGLPVYLVHWRAPEWCLSAVASLQASRGVDLEIYVVDNGGESIEALRAELPETVSVLTTPRNVGFTGGCNRALAHWIQTYPDSDFCVLGAHDLHVEPDALHRMVEAVAHYPGFGILGASITAPSSFSGGWWNGGRAVSLPVEAAQGVSARDWVCGTCMLVRRACVEAIGGLEERLGSYLEDIEYCLRARDAGIGVGIVHQARVHGLGSRSHRGGVLAEANTVFVCTSRGGFAAGVGALCRLVVRAALAGASRLLHRPSLRPRAASAFTALRALPLATWNLVRASATSARTALQTGQTSYPEGGPR
jgi:hypothetical protein